MKNTLTKAAKPQKCTQLNSKNIPCNAYAQKGGQYCWRHSPEVSDDEKKRQSALGGKAAREHDRVKLPPIEINDAHDIVKLLADTLNRIRDGSISQKFAASTAYVAMTLIMAMKEAEAAKERKRIEELKANDLWPEPVISPKKYVHTDKFYLDSAGKRYVLKGSYSFFNSLKPEDNDTSAEFESE